MGGVIVLNTITIGISCDVAKDWSGWLIADAVFAGIFFLELLAKLRIMGLRTFLLGCDRLWHLFEVLLLVLSIFELLLGALERMGSADWSVFRIARLMRITRLIRVCRMEVFCDLVLMIRGALGGIRTLFWSIVLISLPIYAVSLFFRETLGTQQANGKGAEMFATVPLSAFTIFRCVVGADCTDREGWPLFPQIASEYGWGYALFYCGVEILMNFGLFNVIVAIFIENVLAGAKTNDQLLKRQRLRDNSYFGAKVMELVTLIWTTSRTARGFRDSGMIPTSMEGLLREAEDIEITPDLWKQLGQNTIFGEILRDLDVSDDDTVHLFETLDADGSGAIDMEELMEGVAKLRGDARRSDIVAVNLMIQNLASTFKDHCRTSMDTMRSHGEVLQGLQANLGTAALLPRGSGGGGSTGSHGAGGRAHRLEDQGAPR